METKAKLRHLRMSPRKVRLVADAIRGLPVERALEVLNFSGKRAAHPITKLLNSAIANADHNDQLKKDNLLIKEIKVDQGPVLKRWRARAFGRASGIKKRTSHISLILAEIKPTVKKTDKKEKGKKVEELTPTSSSNLPVADGTSQQVPKDVTVVKSLDEVKETGEDITKESKELAETQKSSQQDKSQVEKTKGPKSTKRRFFSRKSG